MPAPHGPNALFSDSAPRAMSVLLVERDPLVLRMFERLLERDAAVRLRCFTSSRDALAWCDDEQPDVIVAGHDQPSLDGLALIERVRGTSAARRLPAMLIASDGLDDIGELAMTAGVNDFLRKPITLSEVRFRIHNLLLERRRQLATWPGVWAIPDDSISAAARTGAGTSLSNDREEEIVLRLAIAAEYRDAGTALHVVRVGRYARAITAELGLDLEAQRLIGLAAPLHDIGKVGIPDTVLLKPEPLDSAEMALMRLHTAVGYGMLIESTLDVFRLGAEIAISHHERFDGSGYPDRLAAAAIPLGGRIVAVADVFDTLTSHRPYKAAWATDAAFAFVSAQRDMHFDPECVEAFLRARESVERIMDECADTRAEDVSGN
jgi:putative two-component system response regulator